MVRAILLPCLTAVWAVAIPLRAEAPANSAGSAPPCQGVRLGRLAVLGAGGATAHYLGFRYFDRAWYQGRKQEHIRWIRDWYGDTYLDLDKGGHFMGGAFMAQSMKDAYTWSGFGPRLAALLGTLTSWAFLFEIEMRDAYFEDWGFSIPDFAANTVGAGVPLLYTLVPTTRALRFKFSYHPSPLYLDRAARRAASQPHTDHLIDDYEGMTFWATLAVDRCLPDRARPVWPDYLGLAVGYSAVGLHGSNAKSKGREKYYKDLPDAQPEVFLGLDCDPQFLPGQGPVWRYLKTQLDWIHFPAPAVRIYPRWAFYLLYM